MIKYELKDGSATLISMELEAENYAKYFLAIFNNARDNKDIFYRVENLSGTNNLYITCNNDYAEKVEHFLEQFGKILNTEKIARKVVHVMTDFRGYEELFGEYFEDEVIFDIEIN